MEDAIPTPSLLVRVVAGINGLLQACNSDGKKNPDDLFDYLLSKVSTAGTNGQF